jgi:mono/diheme cytochrome c family protein
VFKLLIFTLLLAGFLASGAVIITMILGQNPERRNWEIFPDMARSPAYKSQSPNPHFRNKQTEQEPVTGTIPRGSTPLHYTTSVKDFVRAGDELKSPFDERDPPDLARGKKVYQTYCQVCHGPGGRGDGRVVQRGFPGPPSLLFGKALNMKDGHLFYIITVGFRNMPSYASQIEPQDRWLAIAYVRKLQGTQRGS